MNEICANGCEETNACYDAFYGSQLRVLTHTIDNQDFQTACRRAS